MGVPLLMLLLLVVGIGLAAVQPARAADTGYKVTTNVVSTGSFSGFTVANLDTDDGNRATSSSTSYGVISDFDFNVPAGAQIDGIIVQVNGKTDKNNQTAYYDVSLSGNGGSGWTANKSDNFNSRNDATDTLGGVSDNWSWSWGASGFSNANFQLRIRWSSGDGPLEVDLIQVRVYYSAPDLSWATGSADFKIYQSSSLTWDDGTLVCSGTLSDDNGSTIDCTSGTIANSTQYRVQVVLGNIGSTDATMASGDYVDHVAVKGGWAGTSPTLGSCAFNDLDSDNGASPSCNAAWNTNDVRITNTGDTVNIAYADTNNAEGFMYLITTDSDVPTSDSTSYMNASIDTVTEDSSKIRFGGPFPYVAGTATSGEGSNTTTHAVTLPSGIIGGDLLIVFFTVDGNPTVTWPGDWNVIFQAANGSSNRLEIGYKFASGSDSLSISTGTSSEQSAHIAYRITGHDQYRAPEVSPGVNTLTSSTPDPDNLDLSAIGAKNYLWIAVEGNDDGRSTTNGYPTGYGDNQQTRASANSNQGVNIAAASKELNASSDNPQTFSLTDSEDYVACTVAVHPSSTPTAVSLLSFTAQGEGSAVSVEWQTAREFDNVGFHLYRAASPAGPFERINDKLISATQFPGKGGTYSFLDTDVEVGSLYYYKLEDIDVYGKRTLHGPISVDWDADGLPDDWEITHGLSPWVNDADLDYDGDGLTNFEEYERDLDPFNSDTDGDGILDGQEDGRLPVREDNGSRSISRGVEVLAADESGMTLALNTSGFEAEVVTVDGQEFERLHIADYVHGYTSRVGAPQLPLKGLLIDVPEGKAARLSVIKNSAEPFEGYHIYPVPQAVSDTQDGMAAVGTAFVQDELAYDTDGLYPRDVALPGQNYIFRDQFKQQIIFYPMRFNPASGQLVLYRRIEIRIDFIDAHYAQLSPPVQMPWQPPQTAGGMLSSVAISFAAAPLVINPISPLLSSLGAAVTAIWSPPADAHGAVYKILTDAEGIYRLTKDYLETNGIDTDAIDLSQVRLYYLGEEIAIDIFDQNSDDHFDVTDAIRFYAQPVESPHAKYSAQNVYWLTLSGGQGEPRRMARVNGAPSGGLLATDFADIAHTEQNIVYWLKAPGADGIERWFYNIYVQGTQHAGGGQPKAFTISVPEPLSSGTLTISVAGQTDADHELRVAINGSEQSFVWSGISYYEATITDVPLNSGDNTVTLQCLSFDGNDSIIVDWFEVTYQRDYVAAGNTLKFAPDSGSRYLIDGFNETTLLAYDISDPADVAIIDNAVISGTNPYSFEFEPATAGSTYLVLASEVSKIPVGLIEDTAVDLALNASGADYILVTHRDLGWDQNSDELSWLTDLFTHREAQGLRVFVADIEDIYDVFSYGIESPQALKDFLAYAYDNWPAPAPQYVLLVGDSTYDPKDHWGEADDTPYLPTYLIFTDHKGETVTDQWFVTFSGEDAIADMHIGRLPAADAAQAAEMVGKILTYETTPNSKFSDSNAWEKNILLVADNQRSGAEYLYEADFATMNEEAAAWLPAVMNPYPGYLDIHYASAAYLNDFIITTLNNEGALMVNYAGHGATQVWANEHILDTGDLVRFTNTAELPFFVSMSCETGFFAYPETWFFPSLAEGLLRSSSGAVAALMPTGMTTTESQRILNSALFEQIFSEDIRTLGPAINAAKQTLLANGGVEYAQTSQTFLLFGDPAMVLKVPLPHIPRGVTVEPQDEGVRIYWQAALDCNNNPVAGYNVYRSLSAGGIYSKINSALITDTQYLDTGSVSGSAQSSAASADTGYYYGVTSVDSNGDESAQTLSIRPPSLEAGSGTGSGAGGGGAAGCFIATTSPPESFNIGGKILIVIVSTILIFWLLQSIYKPSNKINSAKKKMNPFSELKNVKTLLVDDDEFIRNSLELAFKTKGCYLQVAESAEQGLKAIQQQQYDIIISDLRLPGISGLEFLKLTSVTQPKAIRFLITAYRDDHIFSEAVRLGINEFIEKPFAVKVLINLLALALKRQTSKKGVVGI